MSKRRLWTRSCNNYGCGSTAANSVCLHKEVLFVYGCCATAISVVLHLQVCVVWGAKNRICCGCTTARCVSLQQQNVLSVVWRLYNSIMCGMLGAKNRMVVVVHQRCVVLHQHIVLCCMKNAHVLWLHNYKRRGSTGTISVVCWSTEPPPVKLHRQHVWFIGA